MKQLARVTASVLFTIGLLLLLWQFSSAVLLFLLSLFIAATARPLANRLIARGLPRAAAHSVVYVFGVALFAALLVVISSGLLNELEQASNDLLRNYTLVVETWPNGAAWQQSVAEGLPPPQDLISSLAGERGSKLASGVIGFGSSLFDLLAQLVVVLSLSIYWASDQERFERLWLSLLNAKHRARARSIWRAVETEVGDYVRSELVQSLLGALILGLTFELLGLPYPILLALWAGLVWLIPWVGVLLAVIPVALVGWATGWGDALVASLVTVSVFAALEIWVEPRLYGRSRISPVLVVLTLLVMAQYAGILGMLIAPLLAATIQITGRELFFRPPALASEPVVAAQLVELRKRLAATRLAAADEGVLERYELQSIVGRVQGLLDQANEVLAVEGLLRQPVEPPGLTGDPVPQPVAASAEHSR
ncbi:MAG TPA: AI-2E family transporter [Herpetosiphonaceae bacterium]